MTEASVARLRDAAVKFLQEADDGHDEKYDEQHLRNAHRAGRNATKTKHSGDQCNDQKDDSVVQHGRLGDGRVGIAVGSVRGPRGGVNRQLCRNCVGHC